MMFYIVTARLREDLFGKVLGLYTSRDLALAAIEDAQQDPVARPYTFAVTTWVPDLQLLSPTVTHVR